MDTNNCLVQLTIKFQMGKKEKPPNESQELLTTTRQFHRTMLCVLMSNNFSVETYAAAATIYIHIIYIIHQYLGNTTC